MSLHEWLILMVFHVGKYTIVPWMDGMGISWESKELSPRQFGPLPGNKALLTV